MADDENIIMIRLKLLEEGINEQFQCLQRMLAQIEVLREELINYEHTD